jgi:hypothetical protein
LLLVATLLVGCGGPDEPDDPEPATRDEYMQAVNEAVSCMERGGLRASPIEQGDGSIAIQIGTGLEGPSAEALLDRVYDRCAEEHLNDTQSSYLDSIRPDTEEAELIILDCLIEAGLLEPGEGREELDALVVADPDNLAIQACTSSPFVTTTLDGDG